MEHPINILERYWNYTAFKPQQEAIIQSVLDGEDTFALLPTGGGKSICYQIPALLKDGICIVVSPLIALMKDQVKTLNEKGIKAMALTSGLSFQELDTLLDNAIYGNYKFLYVSPERLQQELVQERIKLMNVSLIAVDEAHCISQWGNDFRPAYRNIVQLRQLKPSVNVIALTASARPKVVDDIISALDFIAPKVFRESFFRAHLAYIVLHENDKYYRLETILQKHKAPAIIYVRNRRLCSEVSGFLESKKISATFYHGGLTAEEKNNNMTRWLEEQKQVMVATNAFGMGIDKPNVKTVIHLNLPDSIESYFQEAGRAGRNDDKAYAILLKNDSDENVVKSQFLSSLPTVQFVKMVYRKLSNYFQISYGEGAYSSFNFNFNAFCKAYDFNALLCYNTLMVLDRNSIINLSRHFRTQVSLQFVVAQHILFNYLDSHSHFEVIVKSILRIYGGIFEYLTPVNTLKIADKASTTETEIIAMLKQLHKDGIIDLDMRKTDAEITFIEPREDDKTINRIASIIEQQRTLRQEQVKAVLDYIGNDKVCRSVQLLSYFGESDSRPCGICDVCLKNKKPKEATPQGLLKNKIIALLEHGDQSSRDIMSHIDSSAEETLSMLNTLLEHDIIAITETNTYKLSHL
ncbi:RecQ family ATP-dependent DNA helicase [Aestuariivivens sediminicola]|uniref:RecQ family ATP-dependent DNA helicase n=1 Tax=Aestuariivivens sediminicola TaxID=2913560 RepID=UPI001F5735A5|nr:RecQ family ATP-dependent DNA helicase [Aestuariivivens sediminicola]